MFIIDILYMVVFYSLLFSLGLPLVNKDTEPLKYRWLLAPLVGWSIWVLVSTVLYQLNTPSKMVCIVLVLLAISSGILCKVKRLYPNRKTLKPLLGILLFTVVSLSIPKWVAGHRYFAYQGNAFDSFNYLEASVAYAKYQRNDLVKLLKDNQIEKTPHLHNPANFLLGERPSAEIAFASTIAWTPSMGIQLFHDYQLLLLGLIVTAVVFFAVNLFPISFHQSLFLSLVFGVGFWGQFTFDLNAWSSLCSVSLLTAASTLWFIYLSKIEDDINTPSILFPLTLLLSASLYLYSEACLFYLPGLGFATLLAIVPKLKSKRVQVRLGLLILVLVFLSLVIVAPFYNQMIGQAVDKAQNQAQAPWGTTFKFMVGRDGWTHAPISNLGDGLQGILGTYFFTPTRALSPTLRFLYRTFLLFLGIAAIFFSFKNVWYLQKQSKPIQYWLEFLFMCACAILTLIIKGSYWGAGKGLLYVAPTFCLIFFLPVLYRASDLNTQVKNATGNFMRLGLLVCFVAVGAQFYFLGLRIHNVATNNLGVAHYRPNLGPEEGGHAGPKSDYRWNIDEMLKQSRACNSIYVNVPDIFVKRYLHIGFMGLDKHFLYSSENSDCVISVKAANGGAILELSSR